MTSEQTNRDTDEIWELSRKLGIAIRWLEKLAPQADGSWVRIINEEESDKQSKYLRPEEITDALLRECGRIPCEVNAGASTSDWKPCTLLAVDADWSKHVMDSNRCVDVWRGKIRILRSEVERLKNREIVNGVSK